MPNSFEVQSSMFKVLAAAFVGCLVAGFTAVAADSWRSLPLIDNGKVAADWQQAGWGTMVVEGDAIRTEPSERGLGLAVYTKEKFGNCEIRVVYRPKNARCN